MNLIYNGRKAKCLELIKLDDNYTIENLYNDVLKLKKTLKDELIKSLQQTVKNLKQRLIEYENIEEPDSEGENEIDKDCKIEINSEIKQNNLPKKKLPIQLIEKLKKKVYKFSIEKDPPILIETFNSIFEAAKDANIAPTSLSKRINMGTNIDGFVWSFTDKLSEDFFSTKNTLVYKLDINLNLLQTFRSMNEAARQENIPITKMQRLCRTNTVIEDVIYSKIIKPDNIKFPKPVNSKAVNKIDSITGNILKTYKSATEAAREVGIYQSGLSRRIKNNTIVNGVLFKMAI